MYLKVLSMDFSTRVVLMILMTKCIAVYINRLEVPPLVPVGVDSMILDCDYSVGEIARSEGLVLKWFFNQMNLIYQWIPPMRPQAIGILKNKVDREFTISELPLQAYRAIKVLRPTTELSGNYTCVVSTYLEEDRRTRHMLVYSSGKNFHFVQQKKYVFFVTLICVAEEMYPKPEMTIIFHGGPIRNTNITVTMNSWGLYTVTSTVVVHDDIVTRPFEEFACIVRLPSANFEANRTTVYYPGLMPTTQMFADEITGRTLNHHSNNSHTIILSRLEIHNLLILFIIWNIF